MLKPDRGSAMYDLDTTADVLLMRPPATAATQQVNETAIEAMLVTAALEGDRDGFGMLYGLYAPLLHGILLCRVPRPDVDDLAQDMLLPACIHSTTQHVMAALEVSIC